MKVKETIVYKYRWPIIGVIVLAVAAWFIFQAVKKDQNENKAERDLLLRQRAEAERALIVRDSLAIVKENNLILEMIELRTKLNEKQKQRERFTKIFIDTASIRTKHKYLDSLLGPK